MSRSSRLAKIGLFALSLFQGTSRPMRPDLRAAPFPRYAPIVHKRRGVSSRAARIRGTSIAFTLMIPLSLVAACAGAGADPGGDDAGAQDATTDAHASPDADARVDEGAPVDASAQDADASADADADADAGTATDADSGADAAADASGDADLGVPLPALPLRTTSRWIVDANGKRFKLASVNWYGAEELDHVVAGLEVRAVGDIAKTIRTMGFNSVRIPFSNELVELDPVPDPARLAANPSLQGKHALAILDAVIDALAHEGLVVILDDHTSRADWCCSETDGNGLWFQAAYPESSWIADWKTMADRYASRPAVVAVDLRNELRAADGHTPTWGTPAGGDPALDWHAAAERGGNAVLGRNPNLLVIVEGLSYANDLTGAYSLPIQLAVPNRLVYSAHDYAFDHSGLTSYANLKTALGNAWGYLLTQNQTYTAPVWVGEFGTCHSADNCVTDTSGQGLWFAGIRQYLADADIDWGYWAINGTQARGAGRTVGGEESYGILDLGWTKPASATLLSSLQAIAPKTQGP